jgi:hypothetical protein
MRIAASLSAIATAFSRRLISMSLAGISPHAHMAAHAERETRTFQRGSKSLAERREMRTRVLS